MFTGIVQEVGEVEEVVPVDNGARIVVRMPVLAPEVGMGDSVAINGTCLTAVELGSERIAFEAMEEVGPGGHFFGAQHTLSRFDSAFYEPMLSDWRNFENWSESGARTGTERAHLIWKDLLRTYEQPALDPAIDEELEAFVARRKTEIHARP